MSTWTRVSNLGAGPQAAAMAAVTVATGDLCIVTCYHRDVITVPTFTSTRGVTYTQIGTTQLAGGVTFPWVSLFAGVAGSSGTETVTGTLSTSRYRLHLVGLNNSLGTPVYDGVTNQGAGSTASASCGSMVTASTDVYAHVGMVSDGGSNTWTATGGFTADANVTSNLYAQFKTGAAATYVGSATASFGLDWAAIGAIWHAPAGGGGRTLRYNASLDGIGGAGPKQFYREG